MKAKVDYPGRPAWAADLPGLYDPVFDVVLHQPRKGEVVTYYPPDGQERPDDDLPAGVGTAGIAADIDDYGVGVTQGRDGRWRVVAAFSGWSTAYSAADECLERRIPDWADEAWLDIADATAAADRLRTTITRRIYAADQAGPLSEEDLWEEGKRT